MKAFKEYKVIGKGGKIFVLMKDSNNKLFKLESLGCDGMNKKFIPIKDLKKAHDMQEPTKEDFNLFLRG